MNVRQIWIIFQKECIDILRDRKTWLGAFFIPLIVLPVVVFVMTSQMQDIKEESRSNVPIAVQGERGTNLEQFLAKQEGIEINSSSSSEKELQQGKIRAILWLPKGFQDSLNQGKQARIRISYDETNQKSAYAKNYLDEKLIEYEKQLVSNRLQSLGVDPLIVQPINLAFQSVASEEKVSGSMVAGIIPFMLVISLASGGMAAAIDLVAGEKERGTLESLVSSPIGALNILTAKLLATMMMAIMSAVASLLSLMIIFSYTKLEEESQTFSLSFLSVEDILILVIIMPTLAGMFAGIQITISTVARTFKEAQTFMSPLVFVAMVPSYMLMMRDISDIPEFYFLLPVFNAAALFKEVFYGGVVPIHVLFTVASSLVYVAISIWLATYFFRREDFLVKT